MQDYLIELLQCPSCRGELDWSIHEKREDRIESADAHCTDCSSSYSVKEGIGLFLDSELDRDDLWEEADSWLIQYLRDNPNVEGQLMDVPLHSLSPAENFFRVFIVVCVGCKVTMDQLAVKTVLCKIGDSVILSPDSAHDSS